MLRLHFYRDKHHEYRWTLFAQNGRKIAVSGEGYKRLGYCRKIGYRLFSKLLALGDKA